MVIKLNHLSTRSIFESGVFSDVSSYDQLTNSIIRYGEANNKDEKTYNDQTGEALEVFAEFFLNRFGTPANPHFGILEAAHTSNNKFQVGYDFGFVDFNGSKGYIQVKFRRNPMHKFTRDELGTFISKADEDDVPKSRRVLFVNQDHRPSDSSNGIFHSSYTGGSKQMRVVDRSYQEEFIDRDPSFWTDFVASLAFSAQEPDNFLPRRTLRPHQQRMFDAVLKQLANGPRGRIICATGGGKTEVEFRTIREVLIEQNGSIAVMVAPTIDLLRQHHQYFEQFGFFHKDKIAVIHFRTGDEAKQDSFIDYSQTTNKEEFGRAMANSVGKKVIIFVTYASEENLFSILRERQTIADVCVWDEFHHTVRQDKNYKEHLLTLPCKHNLFFSASQKRGRIVCSFDEEVYGPLLEEITYAELRTAGILVPQIIVKPIRIKSKSRRLKGISRELKKAAERDNFDIKDAMLEAAAGVVAREDLHCNYGKANVVTFSKSVPICKAIASSKTVQTELSGCLLQTVHASIPAKDRKIAYDKVRLSDDSLLYQFSVVKEGIDITPFNALIMSRRMEVIGVQQGIGRIVRAHPDDTLALQKGLISVDSPIGWKKYFAVVYVVISDQEMENFKEFIKELVRKLQYSGFNREDYQFGDVSEQYSGVNDLNNADVPIENLRELFDIDSLHRYITALQIEMEQNEQYEEAVESINSVETLRTALLNFAM